MFFKKKKPEPIWRDFREKSYQELEQEVDAAYGAEVRARNIKIAVVTVILLFVFHDIIGFWFHFGLPRAATKTEEVIDTTIEPIQEGLYEDEDEIIEYTTLEEEQNIKLRKVASLSISGRVVAKNYLFWGNYLPGGGRTFQSAAMYDLGLVWGNMSDDKYLKNYTFYSVKNATGRWLYPTLKLGVKYPPLPWPYARTHMAHLHIVPANDKIMSALIYLFKKQPVKLDGYLVDVEMGDGRWIRTSVSRMDSGGGACEIMYVNRVQVGRRVYE